MLDEWNAVYVKCSGEKVKLTWNELYVLEYLIDHKDRVATRKELTEAVYGKGSYYRCHNFINQFISRLRKKLDGDIEIINKATLGYCIKYIGD